MEYESKVSLQSASCKRVIVLHSFLFIFFLKDKECRTKIECIFDGVKDKLNDLLQRRHYDPKELTVCISAFYRDRFYAVLDEGLSKQKLSFDGTVSDWQKVHIQCCVKFKE